MNINNHLLHVVLIVSALVLGFVFYRMGKESAGMSADQVASARRYHNYAYVLYAVALVVLGYHLYVRYSHKASMHLAKAHMCGAMH